jgi:hypothetical protein
MSDNQYTPLMMTNSFFNVNYNRVGTDLPTKLQEQIFELSVLTYIKI